MSSGALRNDQPVQVALLNRLNQRRRLEQVVAGCHKESSLGNGATPVTRTSHTLQCDGNRTRRIDLHDQVDRSNVDSKFERRSSDQHLYLAFFQFLLGRKSHFARQTAVMRSDIFFAESFA